VDHVVCVGHAAFSAGGEVVAGLSANDADPSTAVPQRGAPSMTLQDTPPAAEPMSARRTVTDRAVLAGERLLEASNAVGNAYADAYEEAVTSMADFRKKMADARPADWPKLTPGPVRAGKAPIGKPLRDAAKAVSHIEEQLVAVTKRLGLAYLAACEQTVLSTVQLREEAATASGNQWLRSIGTMRAGVVRDVTRSYGDLARHLLA
jgi:hypothetical protein